MQFANLASSFLYGLLLPLAYIGLTMVYHRLKGEAIVEPTTMTRERHPERARKLPGATLGESGGDSGECAWPPSQCHRSPGWRQIPERNDLPVVRLRTVK